MNDLTRLILRMPGADLLLVRRLMTSAKASLNPVVPSGLHAELTFVNSKYLDLLTLEKTTQVAETLMRALPESLNGQKPKIYLTYGEFSAILALLKEAAASSGEDAVASRTVYAQLRLAEMKYYEAESAG